MATTSHAPQDPNATVRLHTAKWEMYHIVTPRDWLISVLTIVGGGGVVDRGARAPGEVLTPKSLIKICTADAPDGCPCLHGAYGRGNGKFNAVQLSRHRVINAIVLPAFTKNILPCLPAVGTLA